MAGPLSRLAEAYACEMRWLYELSHLGRRGAQAGVVAKKLPKGTIAEISTKTKDQRGIGLLIDGAPHLIEAPVSYWRMREITRQYVDAGGHPADLLVWDYDPARDEVIKTRSALDHLLWTAADQKRLEKAEAKNEAQIHR